METSTPATTDFHQWAFDTAQAIREGRFQSLDWERVAEEIQGLGISEESQLESRLAQLIYHLLKMQYQPERRSRSWERSIQAQRTSIYKLLKKQPSLKAYLRDPEALESAYRDVLALGLRDNLPDTVLDRFPDVCPYTLEMVLPDLAW